MQLKHNTRAKATKKTRTKKTQKVAKKTKSSTKKVSSKKSVHSSQKRHLNLHEYQSKQILKDYDVPTTTCGVATTPDEAFILATDMFAAGAEKIAVKSQIHAGGRGKGYFKETMYQGGVHLAADALHAKDYATHMLGKHLITKQTGPEGQLVSKLLIEPTVHVAAEKYFAILMDRKSKGPVMIMSPQGGMNIEEVAHKDPSAVKAITVDIGEGITDAQATEAVDFLGGSTPASHARNVQTIKNLYKLFISTDSTQVEINPLALDGNGVFQCIDAKLNFDDNAAFRQKAIFAQRDTSMEDPRDVQASKFDLNYVGLDGNIGCMVNGAGLAMATMDIIQLYGGWPANFLDVGGGASSRQVEEAFKLLTSDPKVKTIMVNIFGGIMKCDVISAGIVQAARNLNLTNTSLIVRLEGTNVKEGIEILKNSGLPIIPATNLDEAAKLAVEAAAKAENKLM